MTIGLFDAFFVEDMLGTLCQMYSVILRRLYEYPLFIATQKLLQIKSPLFPFFRPHSLPLPPQSPSISAPLLPLPLIFLNKLKRFNVFFFLLIHFVVYLPVTNDFLKR